MESENAAEKTAQKKYRKLGTLEKKASAVFSEEWEMTDEELLSPPDLPLDISSGKMYNGHKERASSQDG